MRSIGSRDEMQLIFYTLLGIITSFTDNLKYVVVVPSFVLRKQRTTEGQAAVPARKC